MPQSMRLFHCILPNGFDMSCQLPPLVFEFGVLLCKELIMYKNARADAEESGMKKEGREQTRPTLPDRCRWCQDYPNCDLDFCLKWWH